MFTDIGSNNPVANDRVRPEDDLDMEFPNMSSLRMNMSPDDMMSRRPSRSSDVRPSSSGSKRKRIMQQIDSLDVIRDVMDCTNAQLRAIAEWPDKTLQSEAFVRWEVLAHLQSILDLSEEDLMKCIMVVMEKTSLMHTFFEMPDHLKRAYCRVILRNNP